MKGGGGPMAWNMCGPKPAGRVVAFRHSTRANPTNVLLFETADGNRLATSCNSERRPTPTVPQIPSLFLEERGAILTQHIPSHRYELVGDWHG